MSRSEDHRKKRPAHLHLARQINAVHDAAKPNVREDHGDVSSADQQGCKRSFCAFTLDGVHLFVFEQRRRQAAEVNGGLTWMEVQSCSRNSRLGPRSKTVVRS